MNEMKFGHLEIGDVFCFPLEHYDNKGLFYRVRPVCPMVKTSKTTWVYKGEDEQHTVETVRVKVLKQLQTREV
jgi:hypothetical protein